MTSSSPSSLRLFTSESVTEGHPDKMCDQISDAILDALLTDDSSARVAVETLVTTGLVHVAGEVEGAGLHQRPQQLGLQVFGSPQRLATFDQPAGGFGEDLRRHRQICLPRGSDLQVQRRAQRFQASCVRPATCSLPNSAVKQQNSSCKPFGSRK